MPASAKLVLSLLPGPVRVSPEYNRPAASRVTGFLPATMI